MSDSERIVRLTDDEVARVTAVAAFHTIRCVILGAKPKAKQSPKERLDATLSGYFAEMVFAKFMGVRWPQRHTLDWEGRKQGDVIVGDHVIEVRSSPHLHPNFLLGQPDDDPDRIYMFVRRAPSGIEFEFEICGWVYGREMKQDKYWDDIGGRGQPCYCVPVLELRPVRRRAVG